ncbi:MAG TPA: Gfo/Idh/MocA family oxidoreductase [Verrucomicrobiae bacterium]
MTPDNTSSRRDFIKTAAVTTAMASSLSFPSVMRGATGDKLKIGLIGCGGRGNGAANQALTADSNCELHAMGDVFADKLQIGLQSLKKLQPEKVNVPAERQFVGLDAYQKVIETCDVVLLTTPPGFRPMHLKAAIEAGKHVFAEKPVATDAPGVRSVIESAALAKKKNLAIVSGFDWRYNYSRREFVKRLHEGAIGDIRSMYVTCMVGAIKPMPDASTRPAGMTDVEWQLRNWYNFVWTCGDCIVENCIHSVDRLLWMMKDEPPIKCVAVGGRNVPNPGGNIYDHFEANYWWSNGARAYAVARHQDRTYFEVADEILGSKGRAFSRADNRQKPVTEIHTEGSEVWKYPGPWNLSYQTEHDELFASIRAGNPINNGHRMAISTMAGIMGRMAAYTGQEITWEMAMNSKEKLVPDNLDWKQPLPAAPMAMPGYTKFS